MNATQYPFIPIQPSEWSPFRLPSLTVTRNLIEFEISKLMLMLCLAEWVLNSARLKFWYLAWPGMAATQSHCERRRSIKNYHFLRIGMKLNPRHAHIFKGKNNSHLNYLFHFGWSHEIHICVKLFVQTKRTSRLYQRQYEIRYKTKDINLMWATNLSNVRFWFFFSTFLFKSESCPIQRLMGIKCVGI